MTTLSNSYRWEAETPDGTIITTGDDLTGCVRVSLIPTVPGLPQHDIIGVPLVRRFGRGFLRVIGAKAPEYVQCVVSKGMRFYVRCSNGSSLVTPEDYELYL